ncbi:MAG: DUF4373 domain-containing protein [Oscillospiraceae bacterium]|nr:DUF4373 domain-containing protein [Oscillospiraceae bacterium]
MRYFPFDVGFFGDRKIRLLRGEHGSEGVEVYIRLLCMCYEDNGYYFTWNSRDDYSLLADATGFSEDKVRLIVSNLLKRSLFDDTLFKSVNVLSSRGIQRRYFEAIKDTKAAAAKNGRQTTIRKDVCLLTEEDFSELNKSTAWLKVAHQDGNSAINLGYSTINESISPINPIKERKENETKENYLLPEDARARIPKSEALAYFTNRFNSLPSETAVAHILYYEKELSADVVKAAIDTALDERKNTWSYLHGILKSLHADGVRCLADFQAREERRAKSRYQEGNNRSKTAKSQQEAYTPSRGSYERTQAALRRVKGESA